MLSSVIKYGVIFWDRILRARGVATWNLRPLLKAIKLLSTNKKILTETLHLEPLALNPELRPVNREP